MKVHQLQIAIVTLMAVPTFGSASSMTFHMNCTLTQFACDQGRDGTVACPTGHPVKAELRADVSYWYLAVEANGLGDAGLTALTRDELRIIPTSRNPLGTVLYYIVGEKGLDGGLTLASSGEAQLNLYRFDNQNSLEDYFSGVCIEDLP
jgi:hypothetical protein